MTNIPEILAIPGMTDWRSRVAATHVRKANYNGKNARTHSILMIVNHIAEGYAGGLDGIMLGTAQKSFHFAIFRDGTIRYYLDVDQAAWQAGTVTKLPRPEIGEPLGMTGYTGLDQAGYLVNEQTIGIEHEGFPEDDLTEAQKQSSIALNTVLAQIFDISPDRIIGHFEFDPYNRANCPGPHFPFEEIRAAIQGGSVMARTPQQQLAIDVVGGFAGLHGHIDGHTTLDELAAHLRAIDHNDIAAEVEDTSKQLKDAVAIMEQSWPV